jgi:hemerythrin
MEVIMSITDVSSHYSIADWNDRYAIGIPEVDSHFRYLFFLFNSDRDSFINYASGNDLNAIFYLLIDHARYQFFAEERWMKHHLFPRLITHENVHGSILTRALDMHKEFSNDIWTLSLEILEVMHLWIQSHVQMSTEEIDDFVAVNQLHNSRQLHDYKIKTFDTAEMILQDWYAYARQTAIGPASFSECVENCLQNNGGISC